MQAAMKSRISDRWGRSVAAPGQVGSRRVLGLALFAVSLTAQAWDDTRRIVASPPACAAGAQCQIAVTPGMMAGQVTLDFRGRVPALPGSAVSVRLLDAAGAVLSERSSFTGADGSVSILVANGQTLPPGRYRYQIQGIAQGQFEVLTAAPPAPPAASPAPPATSAAAGSLAGTWYGIAGTPGSIELSADGSYRFNGRAGGRFQAVPGGLVFDGALAAWNNGRATLKDGVIEFHWKSAEGFNQWFVYSRGQ